MLIIKSAGSLSNGWFIVTADVADVFHPKQCKMFIILPMKYNGLNTVTRWETSHITFISHPIFINHISVVKLKLFVESCNKKQPLGDI